MSENRLTFIKETNKRAKNGHRYGLYNCACGKVIEVTINSVNSNNTKSCGCLNIEKIQERNFKHGKVYTKKYKAWINIKNRCLNKKGKHYKYYGERGVTICNEWLDFKKFDQDMPDPPGKEYSIERIDNNKGYYKENCRWATQKEQNRNQRSNKTLTFNGKTQILEDWAKELHIDQSTLSRRLKSGWSIEKTLTTLPAGKNQYNAKETIQKKLQ